MESEKFQDMGPRRGSRRLSRAAIPQQAWQAVGVQADSPNHRFNTQVQSLAIQASGHEDTLFESEPGYVGREAKGHPRTVFKKRDAKEHENYVQIFSGDDPFQRALPRFWGLLEGDLEVNGAGKEGTEKSQFLILEHLLASFTFAFVMDCKLGIRSYEESECLSKKARPDLYQRLLKIGPEFLNEEDHQKGSITKHKWMSTRDAMSSLQSLGFRVDGVVGPNKLKIHADYYANIVEKSVVVAELKRFLDNLPWGGEDEAVPPRTDNDHVVDAVLVRRQVAGMVAQKVKQVKGHCVASPFVACHEFIGMSLLLNVEAAPPRIQPHVKATLIDLAKTSQLPEGCTVDHQKSWSPGNHEDGILLGLENCFLCWKEVEDLYGEELRALGCVIPRELIADIPLGSSRSSSQLDDLASKNGETNSNGVVSHMRAASNGTRCGSFIAKVCWRQ